MEAKQLHTEVKACLSYLRVLSARILNALSSHPATVEGFRKSIFDLGFSSPKIDMFTMFKFTHVEC